MPDTWAIGQLFPIVPLQRLREEPSVSAVLSDITCYSDGKLAAFIGANARGGRSSRLDVHPLHGSGAPYYLGMFLGGAYQEALGGTHNLFGAPDAVSVVAAAADAGFDISVARPGDASANVLARMGYDPPAMIDRLGRRIQKCSRDCHGDQIAGLIRTSFNASPYLCP
jgi:arginine decarboxylase